jgi:hypothetical protein
MVESLGKPLIGRQRDVRARSGSELGEPTPVELIALSQKMRVDGHGRRNKSGEDSEFEHFECRRRAARRGD